MERVGAVCRRREWIPGCCSTSNNVERFACPARVLTGLHLIYGGARLAPSAAAARSSRVAGGRAGAGAASVAGAAAASGRRVPLPRAASEAEVALRTAQRWLTRYRAEGLAGLARAPARRPGHAAAPDDLRLLIEGLALRPSRHVVPTYRLAPPAGTHHWRYSLLRTSQRSTAPEDNAGAAHRVMTPTTPRQAMTSAGRRPCSLGLPVPSAQKPESTVG